jgi:xylulose-5-phosphate/fructose-6-phosphate phosphoketolase
MLQKPGCFVKVYFPPDGNSTLVVLKSCLESRNSINVIVAGKTQEPRWLTPKLAEKEFSTGIMTWDFASDKDPDIVFAAAGDYLTKEALAAIQIVKSEAPEIKLRFVNVLELSVLGFGNDNCRTPLDLSEYFTEDKPVIFNFHGYPQTIKQALFSCGNEERFSVHGYIENGSTTTPFDMQVRNKTSRFDLAIEAFNLAAGRRVISAETAEKLSEKYSDKLREHGDYIRRYGVDMEEIEKWCWVPRV